MKAASKAILILFILMALPMGKKLLAQSCQGTVPHYTINMTGKADSVWSSTSVARNGRCCGLSSSYRCIHFTVTLDANAMGISIVVSGTSTGYTFESSCGSSTAVGDTLCLTGGGTHELTICRSGTSSNQTYTVRSIKKPTVYAGADTTICSAANSVHLNGTVASNIESYQWTGQGGSFIGSTTSLNPVYIPTLTEIAAGSTYLVLSGTDYTGCTTVRDTMRVTIYSAPLPIISGPTQVCEYAINQAYSVTASTGHSYDWHLVGGRITSGQGTNSVNVTWDTAGPGYIYMVQTDTNGCQGVGAINTLSRFDFNAGPITTATIGPNAISSDSDAYTNGFGFVITNNCGGNKGIDLVVPGSIFNMGKLCMTYSWQRDENQATFFTRGGLTFRVAGGMLEIGMRISDGAGGYTDVGPLSTGYTLPADDVHRYFTFCYDSASGMARVMVHDSLVWSYNGTPGRELYWTGAGDATIGTLMDGSCSGNTLIDWSNISIPISVVAKPDASISGPTPVCQHKQAIYTTVGNSKYSYSWSANGGTIVSGQGNDTVTVLWTTSGNRNLYLTQTDTVTGCDSTATLSVVVNAAPNAAITGPDTICSGVQNLFTAPNLGGVTYLWSSATGSFAGGTANDSAQITFTQYGFHTVSLKITNNTTGCDSTVTLTLFTDSIPVADISGDNPVCEDNAITSYQTVNNAKYTYLWSATNGTIASGQGTNAITATWPTPGAGSVRVQVTKQPGSCVNQDTMVVTIYAKPITGAIQH